MANLKSYKHFHIPVSFSYVHFMYQKYQIVRNKPPKKLKQYPKIKLKSGDILACAYSPGMINFRDYLVEQTPFLYRIFSSIDTSNELEILEFANKYGLLGSRWVVFSNIRTGSNSPWSTRHTGFYAEYIEGWIYEISNMKKALHIWKLIMEKSPQIKKYAEVIRNNMAQAELFLPSALIPSPSLLIKEQNFPIVKEQNFPSLNYIDDDVTVCRQYIKNIINSYLEGCIEKCFADSDDLACTELSFSVMPNNLLTSLWLMFLLEEVLSESPPVNCPYCKEWYRPSKDPRQQYHTLACKQKAYRERKQLAGHS